MPSALTLSALYVYPLKSAAGIALQTSPVGPRGLEHDRRWMVVNSAGRLVTQREHPKMQLIEVALVPAGLVLQAPQMPTLIVPAQPQGSARHAEVWFDHMTGVSVSDEAMRWFQTYLGGDYDLVYMPDSVERWQEGKPYRSLLSFADGNPFHLVTQASVAHLDAQVERHITPPIFRPNLVIGGDLAPYAEDFWRCIQVGDLRFLVVEGCDRCGMINITPQAKVVAEPLRTLTKQRRVGKKVPFGQHLVQDAAPEQRVGELRVGDPVTVLEVGETPNPMY